MNEPPKLTIAELHVADDEPVGRAATRALIGVFLRRVAEGSEDPAQLAHDLMTEPYGSAAGSMDAAIAAIRNRLDPPPGLPKWSRKPKRSS